MYSKRQEQGKWNPGIISRDIPNFCAVLQLQTESWYQFTKHLKQGHCPIKAGVIFYFLLRLSKIKLSCFIAVLGKFRQLKHWKRGVCVRDSSGVHRRLENLQRNHHLPQWASREGVLHGASHNRRGLGGNEWRISRGNEFLFRSLSTYVRSILNQNSFPTIFFYHLFFKIYRRSWRNFPTTSKSQNVCVERLAQPRPQSRFVGCSSPKFYCVAIGCVCWLFTAKGSTNLCDDFSQDDDDDDRCAINILKEEKRNCREVKAWHTKLAWMRFFGWLQVPSKEWVVCIVYWVLKNNRYELSSTHWRKYGNTANVHSQ